MPKEQMDGIQWIHCWLVIPIFIGIYIVLMIIGKFVLEMIVLRELSKMSMGLYQIFHQLYNHLISLAIAIYASCSFAPRGRAKIAAVYMVIGLLFTPKVLDFATSYRDYSGLPWERNVALSFHLLACILPFLYFLRKQRKEKRQPA